MASERSEKGHKPTKKDEHFDDSYEAMRPIVLQDNTDISDIVQHAVRKELDLFRQDMMKMLGEKINALEKRVVAIEQDKSVLSKRMSSCINNWTYRQRNLMILKATHVWSTLL